jgi:hypothetical protein
MQTVSGLLGELIVGSSYIVEICSRVPQTAAIIAVAKHTNYANFFAISHTPRCGEIAHAQNGA